MVYLTLTSDHWVQCSRVGLDAKIYNTPAGGIRASQGTFSSILFKQYVVIQYMIGKFTLSELNYKLVQ